jgi:hypothetical protein
MEIFITALQNLLLVSHPVLAKTHDGFLRLYLLLMQIPRLATNLPHALLFLRSSGCDYLLSDWLRRFRHILCNNVLPCYG